MLIVMMTALILSGLAWRGHVTHRTIQNQSFITQLNWIESAISDWTAEALMYDLHTSVSRVDHLFEVWAAPIAKTALDENITGGPAIVINGEKPYLSGQIVDASSKLNLNNLVLNGNPSAAYLNFFSNLLDNLGLPPILAIVLQKRLQNTYSLSSANETERPVPLIHVSDLKTLPGFNPEVIQTLEPFVIFLPKRVPMNANGSVLTSKEATKVNINTVSAEVLSAMLKGFDLFAARSFVFGLRSRMFFQDINSAKKYLPEISGISDEFFSVSSDFFIALATIHIGRIAAENWTLFLRNNTECLPILHERNLFNEDTLN